MKMMLVLGTLILSLAAMAVETDLPSEIKKTLSCHQSYRSTASPFYEVFEREGFTFARAIANVPNSNPRRSALLLSMTDGDQVYTVTVPSPARTTPQGKTEYDFYGAVHNFKMTVPAKDGNKSFCVSYEPDMIDKDNIRKFEKSPPASCDGALAVTAEVQSGRDALMSLRTIQARIHDNLRASVYNANAYYNNPAKASRFEREAADRLARYNGQKCRGLSYATLFGGTIDKRVDDVETVNARAGAPSAPNSVPAGTTGNGTGRR